ncbi:hypothetical protein [Sandaracinus amylolyticus]|uniref:Response regulator receiver domain/DnaJ domain protein n=1 Tax=Sandaracinus amylolyticus TaxID=927083 RepID=A0A0F6YK50_9BACT|nr:hypothetical protein [Sandaracinus amylolyticus]AKF08891.1 response regulator receiver domain/DnaJ domain protein [Sandaracinus amylolyticus]
MAAEQIAVEIRFDGADDAARKAGKVADSFEEMERASRAAATQAIDFTTKLASAASAVQSLAAEFGAEGGGVGLLAKMAQTAAATAQLGNAFGPSGALVGGIIGAAIPAFVAIGDRLGLTARAQEEAAEAAAAHAEEMQRLSEEAEEAAEQMRAFNAQALARARASVGLQDEGQLVNRLLNARSFETLDEARTALELIDQRIEQLETSGGNRLFIEAQIENLTESAERAREAISFLQEQEDRDRDPRPERRSGPTRAEIEQENVIAFLERERQAREEVLRVIEEQKRAEDERREAAEEYYRTVAEREHQKALDDERIEREAIAAQLERLDDFVQQQDEASRRAQAATEERIASYETVTGVIVGGLTDALTAIIAGEKSAGDAFKGLLASFLEFISEQAALKAAYEAAAAIESFATQDYAGGAQHIAAALAYGAVAVAAGAGAAVLSQPSASSQDKPSGPEERAESEGRGGDTVINFNSPVVTASTRAELGRDLRSMVREADARWS